MKAFAVDKVHVTGIERLKFLLETVVNIVALGENAVLILSHMINFRLFQSERVCR